MAIPDPVTARFDPAPEGMVRLAAWRHRTPNWPHPDLVPIHEERAALLHWWVSAYDVEVNDWGNTDAERPSEYVEMLLEVSQATLTAGLGALMSEFVRRFFERKKGKAEKNKEDRQQDGDAVPPEVRPLMAVTIVNQSGGTVVVRDAVSLGDAALAIDRLTDPRWRGRTVLP
jgi:hypothetical protein